jgi:hypothetical protein
MNFEECLNYVKLKYRKHDFTAFETMVLNEAWNAAISKWQPIATMPLNKDVVIRKIRGKGSIHIGTRTDFIPPLPNGSVILITSNSAPYTSSIHSLDEFDAWCELPED